MHLYSPDLSDAFIQPGPTSDELILDLCLMHSYSLDLDYA